jgi:hypothetical protein
MSSQEQSTQKIAARAVQFSLAFFYFESLHRVNLLGGGCFSFRATLATANQQVTLFM